MLGFSIFCGSIGSFFGAITWRLIEGYSQPGFFRGIEGYDDDGNEISALVWNDWWPLTITLAIGGLWAGLWSYKEWVLEELDA